MKSLIIHAGLHKTGSTSIQNFLGKNRAALSEHGWMYPEFHLGDEKFDNHSAPLRLAFSTQPEKLFFKNLRHVCPDEAASTFLAQLADIRDNHQNVLLSAEGFSQFREHELEAFKTFFSGWKIHVILYVRPAYSYHCSALQEQIKNGSAVDLTRCLLRRSQDIKILKRNFSSIAFFSFKQISTSPGPVSHFVQQLGVSIPVLSERRDNVGLSNMSVRLANHINKIVPPRKKGVCNPDAEKFSATDFSFGNEPFRLNAEELAPIRAQIDKENRELRALTGLDFADEEINVANEGLLSLTEQFKVVASVKRLPPKLRQPIEAYLLDKRLVSRKLIVPSGVSSAVYGLFAVGDLQRKIWRSAMRRIKRLP